MSQAAAAKMADEGVKSVPARKAERAAVMDKMARRRRRKGM